jgi:16S rRNA (uracil1498-N3)-methyltransferase
MHRFFLPPDALTSEKVFFPQPLAHQIRRVLRLKEGMQVLVLDNLGSAFMVQLIRLDEDTVEGKVVEQMPAPAEPRDAITLCISLTQREKFELILQKAVEVGVAAIQPYVSRYSLVRDKVIEGKRRQRWEDILREAAEQSGRGHIPPLLEVDSLPKVIEHCVAGDELCLAAWEGEQTINLKDALHPHSKLDEHHHKLALFIGPEGGFAGQEVELFQAAGVQPVSLGKRILRMETAAIVAPALILYELGVMQL